MNTTSTRNYTHGREAAIVERNELMQLILKLTPEQVQTAIEQVKQLEAAE